MNALIPYSVDVLTEQAGYSQAAANYVQELVNAAVILLKHGELCLTRDWQTFCKKKGALLKTTKSQSQWQRPDENSMTWAIGDYILDYLRYLPMDHKWRNELRFDYEKPKPSNRLAGAHRKRLDFHFESFIPDGVKLVIEAKPLRETSDVISKYLGDSGLERFRRAEEPYSEERLAGMLGYVPSVQVQHYSALIRRELGTLAGCDLVADVFAPPWSSCYSSKHGREGGRPHVWVLHLLLGFPSASAGASTAIDLSKMGTITVGGMQCM